MYVGRFAPSPTGPLHFGSFVAALASWLDARAAGGRWLVRIEDLDAPRTRPGADRQILATLQAFGLHWDGPVLYQSARTAAYGAALDRLAAHTYPCTCSRREIADSAVGRAPDGALIYPGTCRAGPAAARAARAVRLRVPEGEVAFEDGLLGPQRQEVAREVGDFVLLRADGVFSYQLAVVVDDAEQGITQVVRGADLLGSTARQIVLQRLLGLAQPAYLHVPVVLDASGEKLSKQTGATPLEAHADALPRALAFLGQPPARTLKEALRAWDRARVPRRESAAEASA